MNRWLKDPLFHFLLGGAGLFMLYGWQADDNATRPDQIVFTEADVDRLINLWELKWHRQPTQQELKGMVESQVREEVLYREAVAMGLDKDDMMVRRRMAQKMEFISNDLASMVEPDDAQLQTYLDKNSEKFNIPGRISFSQVYLDMGQHGNMVYADAEQLLEELARSTVDIDVTMAGDPFMGGYIFNNETEFGVARIFGQKFARQLFDIPVGVWTGPVESGYGLHLILINSRTDSRAPGLDQVRDKVRVEWLSEQQRKTNDLLYAELRKRYEITIEGPATTAGASE